MSEPGVVTIQSLPEPAVQSETAAIISMIERAARDPAVDLTKLERLWEMHTQMQARAARAQFYAALSAMQAELPTAARRGKAHNDKRYARFEDVVEALRPSLKAHGFSLTYRIKQTPDRVTIIGVLGHAMGHVEETEITLPADSSGSKNPVQAWASSVSYGKRYVALTLTGIATDDDDDGQAAGAGETISEAQYTELANLIKETGTDLVKFLNMGNVQSLSDIPAANFAKAKALLMAKKNKMVKP